MDEIKTLWDWIAVSDMPAGYPDALRFQLATGAPIGEVGGITACEIDQEAWIWTLPADRSKNGRRRATPLVGLAREIAEARIKSAGEGALFLAEGGSPLTSNYVASMLVKRRKHIPIAHFTSHDLRRTVATGLVDIGFSFEIVAAVLGHEAGSKNVRTLLRHYVRSDMIDRKTQAMNAWDRRLREILCGELPPENVTRLDRTDRYEAA